MFVIVALTLAFASPLLVSATDNIYGRWILRQRNGYDYFVNYKYDAKVPSSFRNFIQLGAASWNNVGRELRFGLVSGTTYADVNVDYDDLWWPYNCNTALTQWSLASDESAINWGDITFNNNICNGQYTWYYGTGTLACPKIDLYSVAAHEWGHLVALEHSSQTADTMAPNTLCGDTKQRTLTTHDIAGIKYLYQAH